MRATALLLGHELGIIDGGVYFLQAVAHIALESGRYIRVIEGVADTCGACLEWCTVAGEGSHLVRSYAGFGGLSLFTFGFQAHVATVDKWQQQWRGGAQRASVALDVIGIKATGLEFGQLVLGHLLLVLAALLQALFLGLNEVLFLLGQEFLLPAAVLRLSLYFGFGASLCGFCLGACFLAGLFNFLQNAHLVSLTFGRVWIQLYLAVLLSSPGVEDVVVASDLVGCRYRLVQRRAHPEMPRTHASIARAERRAAAVDAVMHMFPRKGPGRFRRIDLEGDEWERSMRTLEALASGYTHITNAVFATEEWMVRVDLLLREGDRYTPVIVSNHRVARKNEQRKTLAVPTHRLGLSEPLEVPYKLRHHAVDGYRLAFAARALRDLGLDSGCGGAIGQDRTRAFFTETAKFDLERAWNLPLPSAPVRVKECASCRFWALCEQELVAADDISLFLPGDRAKPFRERGITTVQALIDAHLGEPSRLAAAWRAGEVLLRRGGVHVPRADIEVDVDMEAYLDQGAYLWGAWHDGEYFPFVTWEPLGGRAEAENFAAFWRWLMDLRAQAHAEGKTFAAYCYSAHGENHWMRMSAQRFGEVDELEVEEFIASSEWVDMFAHVKSSFAGPYGLGLKVVAPEAGFAWPEEDFDGEESVNARREALAGDHNARQRLLDYNCGDVQATRAVREWMDAGAPGTTAL